MKKRSLYLFTFLFLIVNACQKDQETIPENEKDITIEEVQKKFNEVHSTKSRKANELDIVWDRGIYKDLSVGDALYFPVKSVNTDEGKHYVSIGEETKRFPVAYTSFSRAYKNDLGEVVLEYVMPVPTSNSKEFTGYLVISDWGDEVKRLVYYEEGILVADYGASTFEGTDTESLRKSSNCVIIDHYWCVTVTVGEDVSVTRCTYEGSTMTCKEPPVLAGPNPGPEFGGGGPSEPSGPDGLCAHPFIEGLYVNCDEVICSDGFVADENGNCILCPYGYMPNPNGLGCVPDVPCAGDPLKSMEITNFNQGQGSNRYGCVRDDDTKVCEGRSGSRMHAGVDLVAPIGTNVFSIVSGTVHETRNEDESNGYGNYIIIENNGYYFMYAHLSYEPNFNVGDNILSGQLIGLSGDSDTTGEPHLHIESREKSGGFYSSSPVNIEDFLGTKFDDNNNSQENENCN